MDWKVLIPLFLGLGFEQGRTGKDVEHFTVLIPLFLGLGFEHCYMAVFLVVIWS